MDGALRQTIWGAQHLGPEKKKSNIMDAIIDRILIGCSIFKSINQPLSLDSHHTTL